MKYIVPSSRIYVSYLNTDNFSRNQFFGVLLIREYVFLIFEICFCSSKLSEVTIFHPFINAFYHPGTYFVIANLLGKNWRCSSFGVCSYHLLAIVFEDWSWNFVAVILWRISLLKFGKTSSKWSFCLDFFKYTDNLLTVSQMISLL